MIGQIQEMRCKAIRDLREKVDVEIKRMSSILEELECIVGGQHPCELCQRAVTHRSDAYVRRQ